MMEASGQIKSHLYNSQSKLHRNILSETNCSNHHDDDYNIHNKMTYVRQTERTPYAVVIIFSPYRI